jgi:hypothetical protein
MHGVTNIKICWSLTVCDVFLLTPPAEPRNSVRNYGTAETTHTPINCKLEHCTVQPNGQKGATLQTHDLRKCNSNSRLLLKCDGTRAETRFRLSAKRTSPFQSAEGASVQPTTGSRGVRIGGSNAGYTMFRGSVKGTGYPLHSPVSPSLPHPCDTVCHHISTRL